MEQSLTNLRIIRDQILQRFLLFIIFSYLFFSAPINADDSLIKQTGFRQYTTINGLNQNTINHIYQDKDQLIWLSTNNGLNRLNGETVESLNIPESQLENADVYFVKQDSQNNYWVSTIRKLTKLNRDLSSVTNYKIPSIYPNAIKANHVVDIIEHSPGQHWLICSQGIFLLNETDDDLSVNPASQLLQKNKAFIKGVSEVDGYFWLTTSKGLYRFDPNDDTISQIKLNNLDDNLAFKNILVTPENKLLTLSEGNIYLFDTASINDKNSISLTAKSLYSSNSSIHTIISNNDKYLFAIDDHLYQLDLKTQSYKLLFIFSNMFPKYASYHIRSLFVDKNQKLWIGTNSRGAFVWEPKSIRFKSLLSHINKNEHPDMVWSIEEDPNGNFWVGSNNGLFYLNQSNNSFNRVYPETKAQILPDEKRINQYRIFDIVQQQNTLWLATAAGLIEYHIENNTYQIFNPPNTKNNKPLFIYTIAQTTNHSIWLATSIGVMKFNPKTKSFSYDNALMPANKTELATFIYYKNNVIWLGFANKLISFNLFNQQKKVVFELPQKTLKDDSYLSDFHIKDKTLWVSFSGNGIYAVDISQNLPKIIKHYSNKDGFIDNIIYSLIPDGDHLWSSTHNGIAKINTNDFTYTQYDYYDGLPNSEFNEGAYLKDSKGQILFGGTTDITRIIPSDFNRFNKPPAPYVTSVRIKNKLLSANAISWNDRNLTIPAEENFIEFSLSTLNYLKPYNGKFEYWLEGNNKTTPQMTKNNQIVFSQLKGGNYQLKIRVYSESLQTYSKTTSINFFVKPSLGLSQNIERGLFFALLLAAFIVISLLIYRHKKQDKKTKLLQSNYNNLSAALNGEDRGLWTWDIYGEDIMKSTLTIMHNNNQKLVFELAEYLSLIHSDDRKRVKRAWFSFLKTTATQYEETYRIKINNSWVWTKVVGTVITQNQQNIPSSATGVWLNISQEKKQEHNLQLYKNVINNTKDIIVIADQKLNVVSVNPAFTEETGICASKILDRNLILISKKIVPNLQLSQIKKAMKKQAFYRQNISLFTSDNIELDAVATINYYLNEHQHYQYSIIITDIHPHAQQTTYSSDNNLILQEKFIEAAMVRANAHQSKVIAMAFHLSANSNANKESFSHKALNQTNLSPLTINQFRELTLAVSRHEKFKYIQLNLQNQTILAIFESSLDIHELIFYNEKLRAFIFSQLIQLNPNINTTQKVAATIYTDKNMNKYKLVNDAIDLAKNISLPYERVYYQNQKIQRLADEKVRMKNAIDLAISNNQLFLVYQPKISIDNNQIMGFEVLIRWRNDDGQIIYPSQFIALASQSTAIEKMTRWLISQSLDKMAHWKKQNLKTQFAINLSAKGINVDQTVECLLQSIKANQLKADNVHIEINESDFDTNALLTEQLINKLAQNNFKVTIDNYGLGSLSLANLKTLPIHAIKYDRELIRNIGKDHKAHTIMQSIHAVCQAFNIIVAAKGIETQQQVDFLQSLDVQLLQGYLYSDPLSEENAIQLLKQIYLAPH